MGTESRFLTDEMPGDLVKELDNLIDDLRDTLAVHAPGGMVGSFVVAAELYDAEGEPKLLTIHSRGGTAWTHLGMIEVLRADTEAVLRRNADSD